MTFYDDISKYYDSIFPVSKDTIEFIRSTVGTPPKAILDIACGTGGYSMELDKCGYDLTAVDLDKEMINSLSDKVNNSKSNIKFLALNMLNLHEHFKDVKFEGVYCIGNSVVHLDNLDEVRDFFSSVYKLLKKDGVFIFQIINYDRVLTKDIKSLPTIINETVPLKFERFYNYDESNNKIKFKTVLSLQDRNIENEINLLPLKYSDAISLLQYAGFKDINVYGDFKKNIFNEDTSYSMVIEAR